MKTFNQKSDKGSSVVVQNRNYYLEDSWRQLRKYKFYKKMDRYLTNDHRIKIQEIQE